MFWEKKLETWVDHIRTASALPLRLVLWNGRQYDVGHGVPDVTLRVPQASAIASLLNPSLANLGEAYVEGKIEVEGAVGNIIRVASALAASTLKAEGRFGRLVRSVAHSKKKDAEAIHYH